MEQTQDADFPYVHQAGLPKARQASRFRGAQASLRALNHREGLEVMCSLHLQLSIPPTRALLSHRNYPNPWSEEEMSSVEVLQAEANLVLWQTPLGPHRAEPRAMEMGLGVLMLGAGLPEYGHVEQ